MYVGMRAEKTSLLANIYAILSILTM